MFKTFNRYTDEEFRDILLLSINKPQILGVDMPGFPSRQIQQKFVGSSDEHALREAYNFYIHVKSYCESLGNPIGKKSKVIDFGSGWGRITRFFMKDVKEKNLYGLDVDPIMIKFCQDYVGNANFINIQPQPTLNFKTSSIDVICAYSVFSHLSEDNALKWIEEFSRILKPGGVVLITTQGRDFLEYCESLQDKEHESDWHQVISKAFVPINEARESYDEGKFLFSPTGGGDFRDNSFYGEALIPRGYVEREFTKYLGFRDFIDDKNRLPEALIVMQKE